MNPKVELEGVRPFVSGTESVSACAAARIKKDIK